MENVPRLTIFFCGFSWPPPLPLLLYKVCFSKFWCCFECFFVVWSWLLKNPVAIASTYLPINSWSFKSQSKMLHMQVFAWSNIHEKLPKAVSFTSIYITFNIIVGIGVAKVSVLDDRNFRQSIHFPMVADANGGFCTATGMTVPPLCTLTHSLKCFWTLIFEFREVQTFRNRPFVFSPHPATPLERHVPTPKIKDFI